ncbi:MAG: sigma 54-interacting transcriptional regulator [bacterium]|nr:sigma 54-interacting transcriptional regulator [bacterium]
MRILLVDDDPPRTLTLALARAAPRAEVRIVPVAGPPPDGAPALVVLGPGAVDDGVADRIAALRARHSTAPLVVVTALDRASVAVAVLRAGAADCRPLHGLDELLPAAVAELLHPPPGRARPPAGDDAPLPGLVGASPAIQAVRRLVRTAARTDATVLLEGETGTGKEVVARAVHAVGRRAARPFVPLNCAAIPETLAESELFGHARGAFTGAVQDRPGALRLADGGTLFLDEIEDLPLALQAKLLRVVQDREVRPLGATTVRRVDVRLVAAANRELARMVEDGAFRRDLFYRLRVLTIRLPPLRERRGDLPILVAHFLARFNERHGTVLAPPPPHALRVLGEHPWPGNVRELENTVESLCITAQATGADLGALLRSGDVLGGGLWADERARILRVLEDHRWNRQRSAAALGISRVTLWRRMERHGIRDPLGAPARETA